MPTLVVGHRNPDTDAIASAVGYAWLLNEIGTENCVAGCLGPVNPQTAFALQRFNLEAPPLIADVRPHVEDVTEKIMPFTRDTSIQVACQRISENDHPLPIVDENNQPVGFVSGAGLFRRLVDAFNDQMQLTQRLALPVTDVMESNEFTLRGVENISDILNRVLRSEQDDFVVVDADNHYGGMCRKSALLTAPRRRVILVDHNEVGQSVPGLEEAEIVEILDHHRLNALPTTNPIRLLIEPVGSCSTLVTERAREANVEMPPSIAGLLLCGILSDTLAFRSPTTTPRDHKAAGQLALICGVETMKLADELLEAGAGLASRSPQEIVSTDIKYYPVGEIKVGIAQTEITNFNELAQNLDVLREALQKLLEAEKLSLALLLVTNIVSGDSRLIAVGEERFMPELPYARLPDDTFDAPGVVSRKKQLLPAVLAAVAQSKV